MVFGFWVSGFGLGSKGLGTLEQDALQALQTGKVDVSGNISIELSPGLT